MTHRELYIYRRVVFSAKHCIAADRAQIGACSNLSDPGFILCYKFLKRIRLSLSALVECTNAMALEPTASIAPIRDTWRISIVHFWCALFCRLVLAKSPPWILTATPNCTLPKIVHSQLVVCQQPRSAFEVIKMFHKIYYSN